jgi:hypothetical protein
VIVAHNLLEKQLRGGGSTGAGKSTTKKVILMRRDRQARPEKTLTVADLSQAIEQRRLPYLRQGDKYVLRQVDVRRLGAQHDQTLDGQPEIQPERSTLEVGRSA